MPTTGTREETKVDQKNSDLAGWLLVTALLVGAIIVDSLSHPTKKTKVTVHGTHVDVEPVREAVG